jgi:hypothetical protein
VAAILLTTPLLHAVNNPDSGIHSNARATVLEPFVNREFILNFLTNPDIDNLAIPVATLALLLLFWCFVCFVLRHHSTAGARLTT